MKVSNCQERLKEMMDKLEISQSDIVRKTGIAKSSLSNYVNGNRTPTQEQLSIIADSYGLNPTWLMGYDVPMKYVDSIVNATIRSGLYGEDYTPDNFEDYDERIDIYLKAQKLAKLYYAASPEIRSAVDLLLESSQRKP